jgi:tartrate dehydratase beta subunit/fumarate hydratase class I family protein
VSAIILGVSAAQDQTEESAPNNNMMYLAVVAGCVLLYAIFVKMTQKAEYSEQLTVKEIVTEDVKKGGSSQLNDEDELQMLID